MEQTGMRYNVAPNLFPGWLSDELVIGMGRSMKLTKMLVKVTAYGSQTNVTPPVPKARLDIWLEWWIPGAYRGGNPVLPINGAAKIFQGNRGFPGVVNEKDLCASLDLSGRVPNPPAYDYLAAALPRMITSPKTIGETRCCGTTRASTSQPIPLSAMIRISPWLSFIMIPGHWTPIRQRRNTWAAEREPVRRRDSMIPRSGCTFFKNAVPGVEWKPGEVRSNKNRISSKCQVSHAEGGVRRVW